MTVPSAAPSPDAIARVQALFVEHSEVIRGFIQALMPHFSQADDVLQETFLTVIRKASDFEPGTDFPRWACAIARFKLMEARRKEKRTEDHLTEDVIDLLASMPAARQADIRYEFLEQCLDELAPHTRRAVEMRYEDDHSPGRIAEVLGWTSESTYSVLSRARTFLRECIHRRTTLMEATQP